MDLPESEPLKGGHEPTKTISFLPIPLFKEPPIIYTEKEETAHKGASDLNLLKIKKH